MKAGVHNKCLLNKMFVDKYVALGFELTEIGWGAEIGEKIYIIQVTEDH